MEKGVKLSVMFLIILILLIVNVSALVIVGNNSKIETTYSQGDRLQGKINISFSNESINSTIRIDSSNLMSLSDFLEKNALYSGTDYTCTPQDCEKYYQATNGATSKSFSLEAGKEKILSFRVAGSSVQVNNVKFDISVNNTPGCGNPLSMDFFDDGEINWKSLSFGNDFSCIYETGMGCYSASSSTSEVLLMGNIPFCEKISIPETGQVRLGAWVKNSSTVWHQGMLKMYLYELHSDQPLFSCDLPMPVEDGEIGCSPTTPFNNPAPREYYVCIKPDSDTNYALKKEDVSPCGFYGNPPEMDNTIYHDYSIFAKAAKFEKIGKFTFDFMEYSRQGNLGQMAGDFSSYLAEKYNGACNLGCAIPIKFKAGRNLNIEISNITLGYSTDSGPQPNENKVYDSVINSTKISSGFLNMDLSKANLTVPSVYGETTINVFVGNSLVMSQKINVARVPLIKRVYPNIMPAGIPVVINAEVSSFNRTISSYTWDFGDGSSPQTTNQNHISHIYGTTGTYTLTLTVTDEFGMIRSSEFNMMAGNPSTIVNSTIKEYRARVSNLTGQINGYPEWYKTTLEKKINIEELSDELTLLEKRLYLASSDDEYSSIMSNLTSMEMPISLEETSSGSLPILINREIINLAVLEEVGAGNSNNNSEAYKDAIENWVNLNLDLTADFFTLSLKTDREFSPVLSYFKLTITPKEERDIESYLVLNGETIINSPNTKDIDETTKAVTFTELKESQIEFVVFGEIIPQEIPIYISPEFKELQLSPEDTGKCNYDGVCNKENGENWSNCRKDCKPWGTAVIYLIILLFLAFAAYIGIQEWYKRKYEAYLFKNKNDLFNILNFINNALTKGLKRDEIGKSLKQYGWTSEQIVYAFKKISGKKTGLPLEIKIPDLKLKKDNKNK